MVMPPIPYFSRTCQSIPSNAGDLESSSSRENADPQRKPHAVFLGMTQHHIDHPCRIFSPKNCGPRHTKPQSKQWAVVLTRIAWVWFIIDSSPQVHVRASTELSSKPESDIPSSTLALRLETPASATRFLASSIPMTRSGSNVWVPSALADG